MSRHLTKWSLLIVAASTCLAASPKITFTPSRGPGARAKNPSCAIELFEDTEPSQKFVQLGFINYHDEWHRTSSGTKFEKALPLIQKRACEAGADAIMNVQVREEKRFEFAFINVRVTAIRFEAPQELKP
ncbi:MAG TPA: hypothetical protein VE422_20710 [Terriglobia bacterium]|nr:hypothetical protein [Terriglobia bacterium]